MRAPGMNALGSQARSKAPSSDRAWTPCSRSSIRRWRPAALTLSRASASEGAQTSMPTTRKLGHTRAISIESVPTPAPTSRNVAPSRARPASSPASRGTKRWSRAGKPAETSPAAVSALASVWRQPGAASGPARRARP